MEGLRFFSESLRNVKVSSILLILTLAATSYCATYVDKTTLYFPADINFITHGNYSWGVYNIGIFIFAFQLMYETKTPYLVLYFLVFKDPILLLGLLRCISERSVSKSSSFVIILFSIASLFTLVVGYYFSNHGTLSVHDFLMAKDVAPIAFKFLRASSVANWFVAFLVINDL